MPNGCWEWNGPVNVKTGYGTFTTKHNTTEPAHRWIFERAICAISNDFQIDHICHNRDPNCLDVSQCRHRRCVNPLHLEAVTCQENLARGHTRAAANLLKTHCKYGHLFDYHNGNQRICLTCKRTEARKRLGITKFKVFP